MCEPVVGGSWGCIIFWKSEGGGKTAVKWGKIPPFPPLENTLRSSFHQNFGETKGYSPGVFFRGMKKCVKKSTPSESK